MLKFGRRVSSDPRDRGFLMRRLMGDIRQVSLPSRRSWRLHSKALDQLDTGTCVGQAWRNFLRCAPIQTDASGPSAWDIYRLAVGLDEWTGNDGESMFADGDPGLAEGTSVRAGAVALEQMGYLKSYLWSFELQGALEWLLTQGPLVLGVNWYTSYMEPNAEGIVRITPTATLLGGHAFLVRGADTRRSLARGVNSWGDGWGISGEFWIPFGDLERLIHEDGESCSATQQRRLRPLARPV